LWYNSNVTQDYNNRGVNILYELTDFMKDLKHIKLNHKARGFHPGDDDKLQAAMHKNLHKASEEALAHGDMERPTRVREDIDALEKLKKHDELTDPNDEKPDHPHGGYGKTDSDNI
jgi:hypothetical protein